MNDNARCERFHVITGASGAGKSTLLAALGNLGCSIVPEAALAILREQLQCGGHAIPSADRTAFMAEVFARSMRDHQRARSLPAPVFFDRGIPEFPMWSSRMGVALTPDQLAAVERYRYADTVFLAEPWPEIYVQNHERQHGFERALRSYQPTVAAYVAAGYETCVLPKVSVAERVAFILDKVAARA